MYLTLTFIGAAHAVTGKCTLLEGHRGFLIDCDMENS